MVLVGRWRRAQGRVKVCVCVCVCMYVYVCVCVVIMCVCVCVYSGSLLSVGVNVSNRERVWRRYCVLPHWSGITRVCAVRVLLDGWRIVVYPHVGAGMSRGPVLCGW